MSKMTREAKAAREVEVKKPVVNFMGGTSYEINPIDTLKMVTASSIFGEPQYYRDGEFEKARIKDGKLWIDRLFEDYSLIDSAYKGKKTSEIMEDIIDKALDYDFEATINWAVTLRKEFFMRLNPQVIMVRAAIHPKRVAFNETHPGMFSEINTKVMSRADEPASQLTYYIYRNGSKKNVPNILKRSWAKKIESLNAYSMHKYKNSGIGMIDVIRVCHANNKKIDELMKTGSLEVSESDNTWEVLRASGKTWMEILNSDITINHMALLRNLRGIFKEIEDMEVCKSVLAKLKEGVLSGKQFPYRYYTALNAVKNDNKVNHKSLIMDALEECMDIACDNMPKLKGKTMCLSDNSGSAWGTCPSEYGSVTIAEIDNLSSVITARNSEEGYVGKFGDKLKVYPVGKRNGVLSQATEITHGRSGDVGGATENGIWLFFKNAIENKEHWDNIFIYSDQQAGHGGLYGTDREQREYRKSGYCVNGMYVDVAKLIDTYRKEVNPNVNVFSIQTAGYNNVVIPEYGYRTNIMYGWTGKELTFADTMIKFWDEKAQSKKKNKEA